jgi:phosphatidyl-myo-inositol dimannoside synthase
MEIGHTVMRRALFVTSSFPRWEGDSNTPFVLDLAQALGDFEWQVDVLAPHAAGAAVSEKLGGIRVRRFRYLAPARLETVCYGGGSLINLRKTPADLAKVPPLLLAEAAALYSELRQRTHDVLHSHWILPQGFISSVVCRRWPVPHVATVHGGDIFALRQPVFKPFKRFAIKNADIVTVNSSATDSAVRALAEPRRLDIIPMGVDTESRPTQANVDVIRTLYRRGRGPLIVFIGRLIEEKGVEDILRAVVVLRASFPDVTAVLGGDGQDADRFRVLVGRLGLTDCVFLPGWIEPDRVSTFFRAADVVVAPSRVAPSGWTEAQGLSLIEGMAAGRPVIATRVGGIADAIRDGVTGLQIPERSPAALADAIGRIVNEPALAIRLGLAAAEVAQRRYSRSVAAERFALLYDSLVRGVGSDI